MPETLLVLTNYCDGYSNWDLLAKLRSSLLPLERAGVEVRTLLCIQCRRPGSILIPDTIESSFDGVIHSSSLSISVARNQLLRHCHRHFPSRSGVLFLDDDCYLTMEASAAIIRWMQSGRSGILMGRPPWGIPMPFRGERMIGIGWLWQAYVWTTIFPLQALRGREFNEEIGPGTTSPYQSGEDFLFMLSIIASRTISTVDFSERFIVGHPQRGNAHDKQVKYCRGHAHALVQAICVLDGIYMKCIALFFAAVFLLRPGLRFLFRGEPVACSLAFRRVRAMLREISGTVF